MLLRVRIQRDGDLLFFLSHDVGRTGGRGGRSGCEEWWKPRKRGVDLTTRENREGEAWIVALIPCRD